jgi:hypothetical protein
MLTFLAIGRKTERGEGKLGPKQIWYFPLITMDFSADLIISSLMILALSCDKNF